MVVPSRRWSQPVVKTIRAGLAEQDKNVPASCDGLFRGSGPDQQAHEQPEIVPSNVDQIALVDILPAPQPRPAKTTPVQDVREGALDEFRPGPIRSHPPSRLQLKKTEQRLRFTQSRGFWT